MAKTETEIPVETKPGKNRSTDPTHSTETTQDPLATEAVEATEVDEGRRGPLSAVPRMQHEMERLFDDFMSKNWVRHWRGEFPNFHNVFNHELPRMDVIDREGEVVVKAELPGFTADQIDVSVTDNALTIKGTSRAEREEEGEYHRKEITSSYLTRTIALPAEVDGTQAKARLEDGLLEVSVPKSAKSSRRRIEVES